MTYILTEKPSVARDFAKALGCENKKDYFANEQYTITFCVGHLYQLYNPDDYDEKLQKWELATLPIIPHEFKYKQAETTKERSDFVNQFLHEFADGNHTLIVATDAGREGELIARIALQEAQVTCFERIQRFWVSQALTEDVITEGLAQAKPLHDYDDIAQQGYARQQADWLVGINFTRLVSKKSNTLCKIGRVQTAVLQAIRNRNEENTHFMPSYYTNLYCIIHAGNESVHAKWYDNDDCNFDKANPLLSEVMNKCGKKTDVQLLTSDTKTKEQKPDKLHNITSLQKIMYKKYGYTPDETLQLAQSLYETHKCLSYPRTPSRVMGSSNVSLVKSIYDKLPTWGYEIMTQK